MADLNAIFDAIAEGEDGPDASDDSDFQIDVSEGDDVITVTASTDAEGLVITVGGDISTQNWNLDSILAGISQEDWSSFITYNLNSGDFEGNFNGSLNNGLQPHLNFGVGSGEYSVGVGVTIPW